MKNMYMKKGISELLFQERVLEIAARNNIPVGEKLRFLEIFEENLEEYFRIRKEKKKKTSKKMKRKLREMENRKQEIWWKILEELKEKQEKISEEYRQYSRENCRQLRACLREKQEYFFEEQTEENWCEDTLNRMEWVMEKDRLLVYPYESMQPFFSLLEQAAQADEVEEIAITIYRLAEDSELVKILARAVENGKKVTVIIEVHARYEEEKNQAWARILERAGCKVCCGRKEQKIHAKVCLITKRNKEELQYISHIGTGNYNEDTAKAYTDFSFFTGDESTGKELARFFEEAFKGKIKHSGKIVWFSPVNLKEQLLQKFEEEIAYAKRGEEAYIGIKVNVLSSKEMIKKLVEASKAGVEIQLIVRGVCCLKAGIPKLTENIRVRSLVGRYLEHSRMYLFGKGERQKIYISSADLREKCMKGRVEIAVEIEEQECKERLRRMFEDMMQETENAWEQQLDGSYHWLGEGKEK